MYSILRTDKDFEIRDYAPSIVARVQTIGPYDMASESAMKIITEYASGNNFKKQKIEMSAPFFQRAHAEGWEVSILMPTEYDFYHLPRPVHPSVKFSHLPQHRVAALRFRGPSRYSLIQDKSTELEEWVKKQRLKSFSPLRVVRWPSSSFTLPFFRLHEVHIEVEAE